MSTLTPKDLQIRSLAADACAQIESPVGLFDKTNPPTLLPDPFPAPPPQLAVSTKQPCMEETEG